MAGLSLGVPRFMVLCLCLYLKAPGGLLGAGWGPGSAETLYLLLGSVQGHSCFSVENCRSEVKCV